MYVYVHTSTSTPITSPRITSSAGAGKAALVVAALLVTATVVSVTLIQVWTEMNCFMYNLLPMPCNIDRNDAQG